MNLLYLLKFIFQQDFKLSAFSPRDRMRWNGRAAVAHAMQQQGKFICLRRKTLIEMEKLFRKFSPTFERRSRLASQSCDISLEPQLDWAC